MYNKTNWLDRNVTTPGDYTITKSGGGALSSGDVVTMAESPGVVIQAGTYVIANLMNNIENGIHAVTEKSLNNEKGVNELLMLAEIDSKVIGDNNLGKFYAKAGETFSYSSGSIDFTKAYSATATQGTNTIDVDLMISGVIGDFEAGMEVTLQDATSKENLIVSSVADPTITFTTNIVNSYAGEVNVYRSNISDSGTEFDFGTLTTEVTIDRTTPVQVVNAVYSTAGNGGRKLVRLSSGNLYCAMRNSTTAWYIYKSTDNGATWSSFKTATETVNDIALATDGTNIHTIISFSTSGVKCYSYEEDGTVLNNGVSVDSSQTAMGNCSLTIASNGDLHAAWASKNATYPNSFNIRYSKSTDGGVTWSTVEQVTNDNTTGIDNEEPSIVNNPLGKGVILYTRVATGANGIRAKQWNGSAWATREVHLGTTRIQSTPCATVTSDGDIHVVWDGRDATDSSRQNIRYSKSTDNGATWASETKLTSGNTYNQNSPSIGYDGNDNLYVVWAGDSATYPSIFNIRIIRFNGISWGTVDFLTTNTISNCVNTSVCDNMQTFAEPLTIWTDQEDSDVKFYGEWTATSESDTLTEVDVRLNVTPKVDSENLSAFLFFNDNFATITAKASIVDSTANETYSTMTSTDVDLGTDINEKTSTLSVVTADDRVTLKYELTRTLITDDAEITKIYGGID